MNYLKYFFIVLLACCGSIASRAQNISINDDGSAPDPAAMLDIKSLTKGLLIPRTKTNAIASPPKSLLIYDTSTNTLFYHDGTIWQEIGTGRNWCITGNTGLDETKDFVGTTDTMPFSIRVNNQRSGKIDFRSPDNFSIGWRTMIVNNTGKFNTVAGNSAMTSNNSGSKNIAVGYQSLLANNSGSDNTVVGQEALSNNNSGSSNIAYGISSLYANTSGHTNIAIGVYSMYYNSSSSNNTAVGMYALNQTVSGDQNIAVGGYSLTANATGLDNTALGVFSLVNHQNGSHNTGLGDYASYQDTSGVDNTAVGLQALSANLSGISNTAIGYQCMTFSKTGNWNMAAGSFALPGDTSGNLNTVAGYDAMYWSTNSVENCVLGESSFMPNISGSLNTIVGNQVMGYGNNTNGSVVIGYNSQGIDLINCTAIGHQTNASFPSGLANTTNLGAGSAVSAPYTMAFGNGSVNRWAFARNSVATGVLQVGSSNTNGNGAYLSAGGVWTDISNRGLKENIEPLNNRAVLQNISALPVTRWKYTGTNEYHIGPMAQDFQNTFGIGDGHSVSALDKTGVALLGIQALKQENNILKEKIASLIKRIETLEKNK